MHKKIKKKLIDSISLTKRGIIFQFTPLVKKIKIKENKN